MDGMKHLDPGLELVNGMRFDSGCGLIGLIPDHREVTYRIKTTL